MFDSQISSHMQTWTSAKSQEFFHFWSSIWYVNVFLKAWTHDSQWIEQLRYICFTDNCSAQSAAWVIAAEKYKMRLCPLVFYPGSEIYGNISALCTNSMCLAQDVVDNHEEAANAAPHALRLCELVSFSLEELSSTLSMPTWLSLLHAMLLRGQ